MKKSVLFLMATLICVVVSCQDDKTFDKLVKANQGIETLFTRYPDGSIQATAGKPQTFPAQGIAYSTGTQWGTSIVNNSANWNTAFGWGNHAGLYEPKLGNPTVSGYVLSSTTDGVRSWIPNGSGGSMIYPSTAGIAVYNGTTWGTSIVNNSTNWNTAYGWGNHAGLYKLVSYVPTWAEITGKPNFDALYKPISYIPTWTEITGKPSFATVATTGDYNDLLNKPSAVSTAWVDITGKPTTLGGYGITDAMNTSHPANVITAAAITSWTMAYNWGNHAGLYRPISWVPTWTDVTGKPTFATVATSGLFADLLSKPTTVAGYGITNAMTTTHPANVITSTNITNWNTAYGWGNHAGLYKLITYVPTWAEVTGKPTFATVATSGLFADLLSKPTTVAGYGITNAMTTTHPANVITTTNITNWNTAFGWGNHAGLYKLASYVPTWAEITGKPSTYTPSAHTHTWTEITNKPPEQELIDAIATLGYLPIPGKTTAQISTIVPANGSGIVFDVTLNVYKIYKNGQWVIVTTAN